MTFPTSTSLFNHSLSCQLAGSDSWLHTHLGENPHKCDEKDEEEAYNPTLRLKAWIRAFQVATMVRVPSSLPPTPEDNWAVKLF